MKALIIAGGKGTRMGSSVKHIPKPMLTVCGKPLLEYQVNLLKEYGFTEIIFCLHYLPEVIKNYFEDGKKFGVKISYFIEDQALGTAGCVKAIQDQLQSDFLVLYGDLLINMDLKRFVKYHLDKRSIGTIVVHPNDHPYDSDLVKTDSHNRILQFLNKPHHKSLIYKNLVSAAVYVLSPKIFKYIDKNKKSDFAKDVFPRVIQSNEALYAYNTPEYVKDLGTPQRLREITEDVLSGKFEIMNLKNKRPAIFLDRDGVINKEMDNMRRVEDFELIEKVPGAIKLINSSKYLAVVVANQPMIAKGFLSFEELERIHNKMETLLGNQGAKLDAIYYCPHHPDKGFEGEIKELKIDCECRKPKTGMIDQAVKELNIDLSNSFIIGDSFRDVLCGKNAGITTIGVRTGYGCKDGNEYIQPDYSFENVYEAVNFIVKNLGVGKK